MCKKTIESFSITEATTAFLAHVHENLVPLRVTLLEQSVIALSEDTPPDKCLSTRLRVFPSYFEKIGR
jgi:hypothetical protein